MSTLRTDNVSNSTGTLSTSMTNVVNGSAKAWVNFNGTGTVAIRGSHNVNSITDIGVGTYALNFTTAMLNTDYLLLSGTHDDNVAATFGYQSGTYLEFKTTTSIRVRVAQEPGAGFQLVDRQGIYCVIFA